MEKWVQERLSVCLDFEVPDDMIKYILSLKTPEEFDEYFETLLNKECEDHRLFLSDCKRRLFCKALPNKKANNEQQKQAQSGGSKQMKQNTRSGTADGGAGASNKQQGTKKKNKFVNLFTTDGKLEGNTILLKGRRFCECQASKHALINNCLSCGRIVCEQEGSGPCLFCGAIVCTNEEMRVLKDESKQSENLFKSLQEKGGGESLKKALEERDRLLEYDRNSEKRLTVIDDEFDYFEEQSVWLPEAEREKYENLRKEMHELRHAGRSKRVVKVDFAGRELNDDEQLQKDYEQKLLKEVTALSAATSEADTNKWSNIQQKLTPDLWDVDPRINVERPIYQTSVEGEERVRVPFDLDRIHSRVQDKELLEMQDKRQCLSMHQPWASLLVAGIKKHEGRVWYTEHRGRLWIASTAKEPKEEEIKEMENFYKVLYNDPNIEFPQQYPTGTLLGYVKVEDCLPQEEYREIYPAGESESPFVFICSSPEKLPIVFPIKGQQKIYKLDPKLHCAALKTITRLQKQQKKEQI